MFYYQIVSYTITDLYLNDPDELAGPFDTGSERDEALKKDLDSRDLETDEIVAVMCFRLSVPSSLIQERAYIAGEPDDED